MARSRRALPEEGVISASNTDQHSPSSCVVEDTDGDGLDDGVESNTGTFVFVEGSLPGKRTVDMPLSMILVEQARIDNPDEKGPARKASRMKENARIPDSVRQAADLSAKRGERMFTNGETTLKADASHLRQLRSSRRPIRSTRTRRPGW